MANIFAVKSGNWSDTTVWNTGALPTTNDTVYANTFTVTIDISPTVQAISNYSASGIEATGYFKPAHGTTLTCTAAVGIIGGWNGNRAPYLFELGAGSSASLSSTLAAEGHAVPGASLIRIAGTGTLNLTGNVTGGAESTQQRAIFFSAAGVLNATGIFTGGAHSDGTASAIFLGATAGMVNVTGEVIAQGAAGIDATGPSQINVTGPVHASGSSAGINSSSVTAATTITGPLYNNSGVMAVYAKRLYLTESACSWSFTTSNLAVNRVLYTADSVGGNPATSNVRQGITYGPANELTGTMASPPAESVFLGVPVDHTTGTATISAADIRAAIGLASANLDDQLSTFWDVDTDSLDAPRSIGERLKHCATVETTGEQLTALL